MDLMQLHPKAANDGGDLLRTMEPKDASEEDGYYSTTDMPTELVGGVRVCSRCVGVQKTRVFQTPTVLACFNTVTRNVTLTKKTQHTQHLTGAHRDE
jgi:hypothetical protein